MNAVVHRDYMSTGSVQVMLFKDRLEVWNPGRLPKGMTVEKLAGEHASTGESVVGESCVSGRIYRAGGHGYE